MTEKMIKKLDEFIKEENLLKFSYEADIRFKDGSSMIQWFYSRKNDIIALNNEKTKTVFKQYDKFRKLYPKKTSNFEQRLKEFCEIENVEKYSERKRNLRFKDGTSVNIWFGQNRKRIFSSKDKYSKKVTEDYFKNKDKKHQFFIEPGNEKFIQDSVKFENGIPMCKWFKRKYNELVSLMDTDEEAKEIIEQYNLFCEKQKKESYEKKLKEFAEFPDLRKFNQRYKCEIYFPFGGSMNNFFRVYKERIMNSTDEYSLKIQEDFNTYQILNNRKNDIVTKTPFEERLKEFVQINSLKKYYHKDVKFNDGALTYAWFINNKERILNGTDEFSLIIRKEYEENIRLISFDEKAKEFIKIDNMAKFKSRKKVKFKNGQSAKVWFDYHKGYILTSSKEDCIKIKQQFEKYLFSHDEEFLKECILFLEIEDQKKFGRDSIYNINDVNSHYWFLSRKTLILNSNNPICKEISEEYDSYSKKYVSNKSNNKKEDDYSRLLLEFEQMNNLEKFGDSKIKFKDGSLTKYWFEKYACIICNSKDDISLSILRQFEEYMNSFETSCKYVDSKEFDKKKSKNK